jgi:hypothetical protein
MAATWAAAEPSRSCRLLFAACVSAGRELWGGRAPRRRLSLALLQLLCLRQRAGPCSTFPSTVLWMAGWLVSEPRASPAGGRRTRRGVGIAGTAFGGQVMTPSIAAPSSCLRAQQVAKSGYPAASRVLAARPCGKLRGREPHNIPGPRRVVKVRVSLTSRQRNLRTGRAAPGREGRARGPGGGAARLAGRPAVAARSGEERLRSGSSIERTESQPASLSDPPTPARLLPVLPPSRHSQTTVLSLRASAACRDVCARLHGGHSC